MPIRPQLLADQLAALTQSYFHQDVAIVQKCVVSQLMPAQEASAAMKMTHEVDHAQAVAQQTRSASDQMNALNKVAGNPIEQ